MAVNKIRLASNRVVPKLKDKIEFTDIVNDAVTGGTQKPVSAEVAKNLQDGLNTEIADRGQAIIDLKDGVSADNSTLAKIETNLNNEIADRTAAITSTEGYADAAVLVEKVRAEAEETRLESLIVTGGSSADSNVAAEKARAEGEEARIEAKLDQEIADTNADVTSLTTKITTDVTAEKTRAEGAEASLDARLDSLEGLDTEDGSIAFMVATEKARAVAEEGRIETKIDTEISDRQTAITNEETARDAAIAVETSRASTAEGALSTSINNEVSTRTSEVARVDADVSALSTTVANNLSTVNASINVEASTRLAADQAIEARMSAAEGTLVAGVAWKASLENMAALDALVEGTLEEGQAYYVKSEKDVFVVVPGTNGDHLPDGFTTKSFLKIADFSELSGLVTAERTRAMAAENTNAVAVVTETAQRTSEDTRLEGLISTEKTRAESAEGTLQNNLDAVETAYIAADTAALSASIAREDVIDARITTEVSDLNASINAKDTMTNAALDAEITRATAAEAANLAKINTINSDKTTVGSVDYKVEIETARAKAAELVLTNDLAAEVIARTADVDSEQARAEGVESTLNAKIDAEIADRIADVDTEETRALAAEAAIDARVTQEITDRIADVDAEEARATAAESLLNAKITVINGDASTEGSLAYLAQAQTDYFVANTPRAKLEGMDGSLIVIGDSIQVAYAPIADGVINGEVVVYMTDSQGVNEAIAVNIASISGNTIGLDVVTPGEFNGATAKVHYFYKNSDQTGAGTAGAGEGEAGA